MAVIASSQSPYSPGQGDLFRSQHWDTLALATGVDKYTLFSTPQSSTKNYGETSMTDPGQFPTGVQFFVERIGFRFIPKDNLAVVTDADAASGFFSWAGGTTVTFNITGKQNMGAWHMTNWLNTINLASEHATLTSSLAISNATSAPVWYSVGNYASQTAIPLLSRVRFDVTVENHETSTLSVLNDFRIICILDGYEQRRK